MSKERIRSAPLRYHVSAGPYGRVARRSERRGSSYGLARVPGARVKFRGIYFVRRPACPFLMRLTSFPFSLFFVDRPRRGCFMSFGLIILVYPRLHLPFDLSVIETIFITGAWTQHCVHLPHVIGKPRIEVPRFEHKGGLVGCLEHLLASSTTEPWRLARCPSDANPSLSRLHQLCESIWTCRVCDADLIHIDMLCSATLLHP